MTQKLQEFHLNCITGHCSSILQQHKEAHCPLLKKVALNHCQCTVFYDEDGAYAFIYLRPRFCFGRVLLLLGC